MSDIRYAVLFRGRLVPGATPEQVKSSFSELFGLTGEKLEHLFTQPKVVLKRDTSEEEAKRIAHSLRNIGMEVDLHRLEKQAVITPPKQPSLSRGAPPAKKERMVTSRSAPSMEESESAAQPKGKPSASQNKAAFTSSLSLVEDEPPPQATAEAGNAAGSGGVYNNEFAGAFDRPVYLAAKTEERPFVFTGKGGEYFRIWIVNVFLTIVTLGVYSAWAKVRTQRYFYGNTFLDDSSFEYLADPVKILKGRLIAAFFLIVYIGSDYISWALNAVCFAVLILVTPWIVSKALRFRNHNSAWRGIRFSFEGDAGGAGLAYVIWPVISALTLSALFPVVLQRQTQYAIGQSRFGGKDFQNHAEIRDFYMVFLRLVGIVILGGLIVGFVSAMIPSLSFLLIGGLFFYVFVYYRVNTTNLRYGMTTIGSHAFNSNYEIKSYAFLVLVNWLLIVCTLGLFYPFAKVRSAQYAADHISLMVDGNLDEFVEDVRDDVSAVGGEVGDLFDFDIGF